MDAPELPRHLHSRSERSAWRARRRRRRVGVAIATSLAVVALATVAVALPQRDAPEGGGEPEPVAAPPPAAPGDAFPANGGFDRGMTGWVATAGAVVSWQTSGHVGGSALVRSNPDAPPGTSPAFPDATVTGLVAQGAAPPATAGVELQGTAWVRGSAPGAVVVLRLTERAGDQEVGAGQQEIQLAGGEWQKVSVAHTVAQDDTEIDLEVLAVDLPAGTTVGIDSAAVTVAN